MTEFSNLYCKSDDKHRAMNKYFSTARSLMHLLEGPALLMAYALVFWGLRLTYWLSTAEIPFSDIADNIAVGQRIATTFTFGINDAFYSYFRPVTPSFIAASILISHDHFDWAFRVLVQTITFCSALLVAREVTKLTGRQWLGWVLLFIVALSRPSIFWSLKLSTETVSEALLLASIGLVLNALSTRKPVIFGLAGVASLLLALNTPQFLPSLLLLAVGLLVFSHWFRWGAVCFSIGAVLMWSPWVIRNYMHYGAFIPIATVGADTPIWDYGTVPIRQGRYTELKVDDNVTLPATMSIDQLKNGILAGAPNDYERAKIERRIFWAWFKANWMDYPRLFTWRFKQLISQNGASGLTHVPRDHLFTASNPGYNTGGLTNVALLDMMLFDKSALVWLLALAGCALLLIRHGLAGCAVVTLWLVPWGTVALATGYERAVESMISFTLWLATYAIGEIVVMLTKKPNLSATVTNPLKRGVSMVVF